MLSLGRRSSYAPSLEVVERKGMGHPDTLCDHLAESLARQLSSLMMKRTGGMGHFNVDKGLLVAGEADVRPGGGRIREPARVILAGRVDLEALGTGPTELTGLLEEDLARSLPAAPLGAVKLELQVNRPAADLADLTIGLHGAPLANDTSFAVVSLPRTPLEETVHRVTDHLNDATTLERLPIGTDVKVMGHRENHRTGLIVAAPVLAERVSGERSYRAVVAEVEREVSRVAGEVAGDVPEIRVNAAPGLYLSLIGSSAEAGDDGEVGRGNDFGGLIAPMRPRSGEAPAGKNPVSHVGKIYHAMAHDMADRLVGVAGEVTVGLLSRIGAPVSEPVVARVDTLEPVNEERVAAVVRDVLHDWEGVRNRLLEGHYELY